MDKVILAIAASTWILGSLAIYLNADKDFVQAVTVDRITFGLVAQIAILFGLILFVV
jgi:DMSO/TMAO reductase YedYZ heme-binding membrane subunit